MYYKQPDDFGSNKCSVKYSMQKKKNGALLLVPSVHVAEYAVTLRHTE